MPYKEHIEIAFNLAVFHIHQNYIHGFRNYFLLTTSIMGLISLNC